MITPQPPTQDGTQSIAWVSYFSEVTRFFAGLPKSGALLSNFANDAAAAAGGVPLYGYYRNGSIVMQRIV